MQQGLVPGAVGVPGWSTSCANHFKMFKMLIGPVCHLQAKRRANTSTRSGTAAAMQMARAAVASAASGVVMRRLLQKTVRAAGAAASAVMTPPRLTGAGRWAFTLSSMAVTSVSKCTQGKGGPAAVAAAAATAADAAVLQSCGCSSAAAAMSAAAAALQQQGCRMCFQHCWRQ